MKSLLHGDNLAYFCEIVREYVLFARNMSCQELTIDSIQLPEQELSLLT